jgi:hypothetical protein
LDGKRLVEAVVVAEGCDGLRIGLRERPEVRANRIAGDQLRQDERDERDPDDERDERCKPSEDEADERSGWQ